RAAARDTAMNPAVIDAFALVIIAGEGPPAFPGIPGHEPDLAVARENARSIARAMRCRRAVPTFRRLVSSPHRGDGRMGGRTPPACARSSANTIPKGFSSFTTVLAAKTGARTATRAFVPRFSGVRRAARRRIVDAQESFLMRGSRITIFSSLRDRIKPKEVLKCCRARMCR